MSKVVVFNGINVLDFSEVRTNVVRIPEVSRRIFAAQEIWDSSQERAFSFHNFIVADDGYFLSNIKLKALVTGVVQLGLYDRYLKQFGGPDFMVGPSNGDSPLKVALGQQSFRDWLLQSEVIEQKKCGGHLQVAGETLLTGVALTEYQAFFAQDGPLKVKTELEELLTNQSDKSSDERAQAGKPVAQADMDIHHVLRSLIADYQVQTIVNIGPGHALVHRGQEPYALSDLQILESIDLDPMLGWFWREIQRAEAAQAG